MANDIAAVLKRIAGDGFWYVGTPYSRYHLGTDAAERHAAELTAALTLAGVPVFSPIVHSHRLCTAAAIDALDSVFWLKVDAPFMRAAVGLLIGALPGWADSHGLNVEREQFTAMGKPVMLVSPCALGLEGLT